MHIAKFIEEQKRLNPEPKYWFHRKSAWYERVVMSVVALCGLVIAIYVPVRFVTAPAEVIGDHYGFAIGITIAMTYAGLSMMVLGGWAAIAAFRKKDGLSHLEAAIMFVIIWALATVFSNVIHQTFEQRMQLEQEAQIGLSLKENK